MNISTPCVLVACEDDGQRYFRAETNEQLYNSAITLLRERIDSTKGWYDWDDDNGDSLKKAVKALHDSVANGKHDSALRFLLSRNDYEYELVSLRPLEG